MNYKNFCIVAGLIMLAGAATSLAPVTLNPDIEGAQRLDYQQQQRQAQQTLPAGRPSSCPLGCTVRGTCNEELGRCDCPRHLTGPACDMPTENLAAICGQYHLKLDGDCTQGTDLCLNNCNGRGECVAGVCQCHPGYWGMDCSISWGSNGRPQLLDGKYQPRKTGVKIYVYELPPNLTTWNYLGHMDRPTHYVIWQRLMASGVRTLDGDAADFYFIPIYTRGYLISEHLGYALSYIRTTWPWWNKDNGQRHLMVHPGDMGVNELRAPLRNHWGDHLSNITWLTHWGLYEDHPVWKWHKAHRPGKDIVIPVLTPSHGFSESPLNPANAAAAKVHGHDPAHARKGMFFFAGTICGDGKPPDDTTGLCRTREADSYSLGVRQAVYFHHHNRTGYKVVLHSKSYLHDMASHKFCLAPVGGGHGKRQILVSLMGCVPVLIADGVLQPFEPEIDWRLFSVSVAEKDIPDLPAIMKAVPATKLLAMQKRLRCMAQHFYYSSSLGSVLGDDGRYDAFETLMEILRVRRDHPDVPPEEYTKVDERFRNFVNCRLDGPEVAPLCTQSKAPQFPDRIPCGQCPLTGSVLTIPGGLMCCRDADQAKCPRVWP